MADPLSITTGVVALLGTCIKLATAIKGFHDGAAIADVKVTGLLSDVESFTNVLQMLKSTLEEDKIKKSLQATGHIGSYWTNLSKSIKDGQNTLVKLQETLERVNKSVGVLNRARKHLRLKGAMEKITMFQQQIRSYHDTMQLSLQTVILWNQVTFKESNGNILPKLDELHQSIRRIAFDINTRNVTLQTLVESNAKNEQIQILDNLRSCVQSAASIVSSASTTLGIEHSDTFSVAFGSEFGDCLPSGPSETMLRWLSSNTVYEFEKDLREDASTQIENRLTGKEQNTQQSESDAGDHSDSDSELEITKVRALLRDGKGLASCGEFKDAERLSRNCLTRITSSSQFSTYRELKLEIMDLLAECCKEESKWSEAQALLMELIALRSLGSHGDSSEVLVNILTLSEVLLLKSAYAEALLYAKRAYKGYRRMGNSGIEGVTAALEQLIEISLEQRNADEVEAYLAILSENPKVWPESDDDFHGIKFIEYKRALEALKTYSENQQAKENGSQPTFDVSQVNGNYHHRPGLEVDTGTFMFRWPHPARDDVWVTGSFDNWSKSTKLDKIGNGFAKLVKLQRTEKIYYKFVVDGYWANDLSAPHEYDASGNPHNFITGNDIQMIGFQSFAVNSPPPVSYAAAPMTWVAPATPAYNSSPIYAPTPPTAISGGSPFDDGLYHTQPYDNGMGFQRGSSAPSTAISGGSPFDDGRYHPQPYDNGMGFQRSFQPPWNA